MNLRPFGRLALLVELDSTDAVHALAAALDRSPARGQVDVVPAERSLLVTFESEGLLDAAVEHVRSLDPHAARHRASRTVELPARYDGEDLAAVADALGLTVREVIERHAAASWTVAFTGFAPGFAYLVADGDPLVLPRRSSPRTAVPAGSVAIADRYSAVYPRSSPGGWHLLGRTDAALWDSSRTPPALLAAGDSVRFVPVAAVRAVSIEVRAPRTAGALEVVHPGLQSLVQDGGRAGHLADAVPRSGAADRASWVAGNLLVGNAVDAASIESVLGGLTVTAREPLVVAITGASPGGWIEQRWMDAWRPFALRPGDTLQLDPPGRGLRSYLSVRGGIDVPLELGSRSTDLLTGLGPPPLTAGDVLPTGDRTAGAAEPRVTPVPMPGAELEVRVTGAAASLLDRAWTVTGESNRVGIRLSGESVAGSGSGPSAPLVSGAVQLPPSGLPIVFLRDHPATGGYPVIGVVDAAGLDSLAQARPGTVLRFTAG